MDRHRGDRYDNSPDLHPYRNSRGPPRSSDSPMNHHRRPSPNNYRDEFSGAGVGDGRSGYHHRPFDSPPRFPPVGGRGGNPGVGFRPMSGGIFNSDQMPLSGQKRGYPFATRGGSPDHLDSGNFAKLFVGSVPRTANEEEIRPLFEEHGNVLEVALIKDKRTGQQQGSLRGLTGAPVSLCSVSVSFPAIFSLLVIWYRLSLTVRSVNQEEDRKNAKKQFTCSSWEPGRH